MNVEPFELQDLRRQLAACTSATKQLALMNRIKKLEKELGIDSKPRVPSKPRPVMETGQDKSSSPAKAAKPIITTA